MDMPDDTPTKLRRDEEDEQDQQFEANEQNFSSFQSNPKHYEESSSSIDEDGFKNMHTYKQKQLKFPEVPSNLPKLYQIYIHNVTRKQELKKAIQVLIEKQIKALRIAYDKDNFSIEEMIDLEEESSEYKLSKKNYEERKSQLEKLARHYRQLKIMHVESMMVLDPIMKNTLNTYTQKNKEIIYLNFTQDTVFALCKQKYKPRKIRKLKIKKGTKKTINQQSSRSEQQGEEELLNALDKAAKSRNTSQTVSSQEQDPKVHSKFIFRNFKFFKTHNGVSFQPFQQLLELPTDKEYIGFIVQPNSKNYLAYEEKKLYILNSSQKELKIKKELSFDRRIIFCEIFKNFLYVGTKDGLMRVYDIKEGCNLIINKIVLCTYGSDEQITHFALTNNPDIIVFVKKSMHLCEMNLASYSGYLLSQLQEPIQFIDHRLILTKSCVYLDYYASGGSHGKAILQHHQKLKKASKNRKIVKCHKHNQTDYVIFDEGSGVFSVQNFSQILKK